MHRSISGRVLPRKLTRLSCRPRKLAPGVSAMYGMRRSRRTCAIASLPNPASASTLRIGAVSFMRSSRLSSKEVALYRVGSAATMQGRAKMAPCSGSSHSPGSSHARLHRRNRSPRSRRPASCAPRSTTAMRFSRPRMRTGSRKEFRWISRVRSARASAFRSSSSPLIPQGKCPRRSASGTSRSSPSIRRARPTSRSPRRTSSSKAPISFLQILLSSRTRKSIARVRAWSSAPAAPTTSSSRARSRRRRSCARRRRPRSST